MKKYINWRLAVIVCCFICLIFAAVILPQFEKNIYFNVPVLSQEQYDRLSFSNQEDGGCSVRLDGFPAPLDSATDTIYLPHKIYGSSLENNSTGVLSTDTSEYSLCFAPDDSFADLAAAMEANHRFRLLLVKDQRVCREYGVVFTDLPVISIEGDVSGIRENGRDEYTGMMYLWDPCEKETMMYYSTQSNLQWHVRGQTVSQNPKKSWKASTIYKGGQKRDISLCGLGEDDDWIFNALYMDDLKFREKFVMELWKQMCTDNPDNPKMSDGEFAEIICNGEYQGLYLIQRRVDGKYLDLGDDTILVKGRKIYEESSAEIAYEIIHSSLPADKTYEFLNSETIHTENYRDHIDFSNWTDVSLIMSLGAMVDNYGNNNNFLLFENTDGNYTADYILWDTDMSFGITWSDKFIYRPDSMITEIKNKKERGYLKDLHPDLNHYTYDRWMQLRQTILSEENLRSLIESEDAVLRRSGAHQRDTDLNGLRYDGEDTVESLYSFISRRLQFLDEYYYEKTL